MPSTYSTNLKIELQATGENSGTWGTITNTNLGTALEQAIVGYGNPNFGSDANLTLSYTDTNAAQAARALVLNVTSTGSLSTTRELIVPTIQKQYIVQNNTSGGQSITVKTSAGTGITVPNGRKAHLYVDGTNVIYMDDYVDINGGAIDGTPIGANSASTGSFTTLGATTGNITTVNATTVDATNVEVTNIKAKDGTAAATIADSTGVISLSANPTLSGGTANGVLYLNGSKVATSGTGLEFDGTNFGVGTGGNTINNRCVIYRGGANAVYHQVANGSTGLASSNGIRLGLTSGGTGELYSPTALISYIDNAEQMRLTSTGLGIGTSSPSQKLHVNGNVIVPVGNAYFTFDSRFGIGTPDLSGLQIFTGDLIRFGTRTSGGVFTDRMLLDSSGNLGLGVTPSAWAASWKVFENQGGFLGANSTDGIVVSNNSYSNGTNWIYKNTKAASQYTQLSGAHLWYTAPSGTAGNAISFTQAMTLDASGNLGVGTTSIASGGAGTVNVNFHTPSANPVYFKLSNASTGNTTSDGFDLIAGSDGSALLVNRENQPMIFYTNASERARIDASGNLLVGNTSSFNPATGRVQININGASESLLGFGAGGNSKGYIYTDGTDFFAFNTANGAYRFGTNGTERARIDASGNLGLGVTPSAWSGLGQIFQLQDGSVLAFSGTTGTMAANAYFNSGYKYITSNFATRYTQALGKHEWYTAPSGTAGNAISFTQAMTLDASGNLLVGQQTGASTTTPVRISSGGTYGTTLANGTKFVAFDDGTIRHGMGVINGQLYLNTNDSATVLVFGTNNTERARITSGGDFGIGTSSPVARLHVAKSDGVNDVTIRLQQLANGTASGIDLVANNDVGSAYNFIRSLTNAGTENWRITGGGSNNVMAFWTNSTERARITAGGNLLVGTSTDLGYAARLDVDSGGGETAAFKSSGGASSYVQRVWNSATSGDNLFVWFGTEAGGTTRGSITYNRGAGQVAYNTTSDARLKENIADAEEAGSKIDAMQVRQFDWKETGNHLDYGFVAQELHAVAPHAVSKPEDVDAMWSVDYSKLVPMLVKEIQSLRARVAQLESK